MNSTKIIIINLNTIYKIIKRSKYHFWKKIIYFLQSISLIINLKIILKLFGLKLSILKIVRIMNIFSHIIITKMLFKNSVNLNT
jgi:hypothetical protein